MNKTWRENKLGALTFWYILPIMNRISKVMLLAVCSAFLSITAHSLTGLLQARRGLRLPPIYGDGGGGRTGSHAKKRLGVEQNGPGGI